MKRPPLGAWIAVGLIGAAAVLPTATYAVTGRSLVIADGKSANTATVDSAGRLLAAPSAPSQMLTIQGDLLNGACNNFYTVLNSKALIITAADFLLSSPGSGAGYNFSEGDVYGNLGANCTIAANTRYLASGAIVLPDGSLIVHEDQNHDYGTGIAVPAGTVLGDVGQDTTGNVLLFEYLVPQTSVPADALTSLPRADRTGRPLAP